MMSSVPAADKKFKLLVYAIEECPVCGQKTKRAFQVGDYITKDGAKCTKCSNQTRVSLVYAESSKPSGPSLQVKTTSPPSSSANVCSN